jgi:MYXO-CTERM domain-containing protein
MPFCAPEDADQGERLQNLAIQYSRLALEDYPWREGYTYAAIGWDKIVTDLFGNEPEDSRHNRLVFGSIELITDAHYILGDIARWLRSPTGFSGGTAPASVDHVISLGFSQTALLQNSFLQGGFNEEEGGGLVYDGFLLQSGGVFCWQFGALPNVCHGEFPFIASPGEAKRIVIATESDVQAIMGASLNRGPVENHVQYEIAGLAHNSGKLLDTTFLGATQQNPQDPSPFARGALRNLTRWIVDGTAPPPALHLEGDPNTFDPNSGGMTVDRDADGNVLGGVRPPWMPSMVEDMPAGAPLGVYGGLDVSGFDPFNVFLLLSGTFQPFSDSEIESRYPTPEAYKELVTRAADHLLAEEYILEEDRDAYVANAILELPELPPLGTPDAGPGETDPPDGGCGCRLGDDGSSGAGMGWLVLLFGTLLGVRRGWRR